VKARGNSVNTISSLVTAFLFAELCDFQSFYFFDFFSQRLANDYRWQNFSSICKQNITQSLIERTNGASFIKKFDPSH
jgi:hypothetical protein